MMAKRSLSTPKAGPKGGRAVHVDDVPISVIIQLGKLSLQYGKDNCWPWPGPKRKGYGLYAGKLVHRLSYAVFNGTTPAGLVVMHNCDHKWCANWHHLKAGTQRENMDDHFQKGLHIFTENQINSARESIKIAMEANKRKVIGPDGVIFDTVKEAADSIDRSIATIIRRCKASGSGWRYAVAKRLGRRHSLSG